MVPLAARRAIRFCTVPRATPRALAREATEARASLRSSPISCRSMSSIKLTITQIANNRWRFDHQTATSVQDSGFILVLAGPTMLEEAEVRDGRGRELWRAFMVDFIGIERIQELVSRWGAARFIEELAREIESDFLRWSEFEKSPRHGSNSSVG